MLLGFTPRWVTPAVFAWAEARVHVSGFLLREREELGFGRRRELRRECAAEERRGDRETLRGAPRKQRGRVEDAERLDALAARNEDAEALRGVSGRDDAEGLDDDREARRAERGEARAGTRETFAQKGGERGSRERGDEAVGLEGARGGAHDPRGAPCSRALQREGRGVQVKRAAALGDARRERFHEALEAGSEVHGAALHPGRPRAGWLRRLQESPDHASATCLGVPERGERAPHRERARIVGVDAGDHRARGVAGETRAEAALEEVVDAFVLEVRAAPRNGEVSQDAQLLAESERLREEALRARNHGLRGAVPVDPARRVLVGPHDLAVEPEPREKDVGLAVRAQRVGPALEDEAILANRGDGAAGPRRGLEHGDGETHRALEQDSLGRREPGETGAQYDDSHSAAACLDTRASVSATTLRSASMKRGESLRPAAGTKCVMPRARASSAKSMLIS